MKIKLTIIIPVYNQERLVLRALKSIPCRDDIEIVVVDDCSTDGTFEEISIYRNYSKQNIILLQNEENKGVGYTVNKGIDVAQGEYIVLLGSDDYFVDLNEALDELTGEDMIYFDLEINDGSIFHLDQESKHGYCGSTKFIKREFIGDIRNPELRAREDYFFYQQLLKKNPKEKFLNRIYKHYNFPQKDSLTDKALRGEYV